MIQFHEGQEVEVRTRNPDYHHRYDFVAQGEGRCRATWLGRPVSELNSRRHAAVFDAAHIRAVTP
jgi:hypothetical protein